MIIVQNKIVYFSQLFEVVTRNLAPLIVDSVTSLSNIVMPYFLCHLTYIKFHPYRVIHFLSISMITAIFSLSPNIY